MFCRRRLIRCCLDLQKNGFGARQPTSQARPSPLRRRVANDVGARSMSSNSSRERPNPFEDESSIFGSKQSAWDHVFADEPSRRGPPPETFQQQSVRRQTITPSERIVIRQMLDEVIQTKRERSPEAVAKATALLETIEAPRKRRLGNHERRQIAQAAGDPATRLLLDEMKQAIDLCSTKTEALEWAQQNVFPIIELDGASESAHTTTMQQLILFRGIIPDLMRKFRVQFNDPNLALFVFKAVRHNSIPTYVYGCSADAYNELITLLWDSFRDLRGVRDALQEMLVNSFEANSQTEAIAERICREAMNDQLWLDHTEEGDQVAMSTLSSISDLLIELNAAKSNEAGKWGRVKRDLVHKSDSELDDSLLDL